MTKSRTIATFEAKCADCGEVFAAPCLGDFTYGQFLLFGIQGTVFRYLDAIDCPIFELAASVMLRNSDKHVCDVVASVADLADGQRMTAKQICPKCHSDHWARWDGRRMGEVVIPDATFDAFNRLSDEMKRKRLLEFESE